MLNLIIKIISYSFIFIPGRCKKNNKLEGELKKQAKRIEEVRHSGKDALWLTFEKQIVTNVLEKKMCNFLRWKVIKQTMFPISSSYLLTEFKSIRSNNNWTIKWKDALVESYTGSPVKYWRYPKSSGNTIHMAYHLLSLEKITNIDISSYDLIVEFGGGYGNMCRVSYNSGYVGEYCIYDIEIMTEIQKYYLAMSSKDSNSLLSDNVLYYSDFKKIEDIVNSSQDKKILFIATWSLSESPIEIRERAVSLFDKIDTIFIAFQNNFSSYDNQMFFEKVRQETSKNWTLKKIEHMQNDNYLIGTKKQ